mgnify:CR=1 FL=1
MKLSIGQILSFTKSKGRIFRKYNSLKNHEAVYENNIHEITLFIKHEIKENHFLCELLLWNLDGVSQKEKYHIKECFIFIKENQRFQTSIYYMQNGIYYPGNCLNTTYEHDIKTALIS